MSFKIEEGIVQEVGNHGALSFTPGNGEFNPTVTSHLLYDGTLGGAKLPGPGRVLRGGTEAGQGFFFEFTNSNGETELLPIEAE